jgi:hypothetical protein
MLHAGMHGATPHEPQADTACMIQCLMWWWWWSCYWWLTFDACGHLQISRLWLFVGGTSWCWPLAMLQHTYSSRAWRKLAIWARLQVVILLSLLHRASMDLSVLVCLVAAPDYLQSGIERTRKHSFVCRHVLICIDTFLYVQTHYYTHILRFIDTYTFYIWTYMRMSFLYV